MFMRLQRAFGWSNSHGMNEFLHDDKSPVQIHLTERFDDVLMGFEVDIIGYKVLEKQFQFRKCHQTVLKIVADTMRMPWARLFDIVRKAFNHLHFKSILRRLSKVLCSL